ncbi:hypothetical protein A3I48_03060 [Candidatus Daviesbacteria bacterium RIFCSPLOWO2_02_FULL_36_7]|uniref:Type II secretion system protein GspG C-terminal domain-containing protein n=1 Tax=Candidatus Daviesbacteria bacterium RIFCSPLOWO2_02_FULL_36_7 TaxID=1797792 RepID=A0A1F5MG73_9BACT|nr:MAG: hypothetical protein A3I48_03060 [Candidatus Daviesbacteria bacterium RIFCSPLOWO2_02_FULL_36_7]
MKKDRGFTLVELLVTLSIIAVLMAISITSYDNLTKNARDGQRKSDLKQIQSALEQYYRDNTTYPSSLPVSSWSPYLNQVPTEAVTGNPSYKYVSSTSITKHFYCLYAKMENTVNAGLIAGCPSSRRGYNYSVSSP